MMLTQFSSKVQRYRATKVTDLKYVYFIFVMQCYLVLVYFFILNVLVNREQVHVQRTLDAIWYEGWDVLGREIMYI